ncbi:ATP-dependent DNA helicase DinG [Vibrio splendidus]|nr:ATP-dependent DNA helicase DinG [Vibrio splendidus]MCC4883013.1 ATP-dependent DNA helicase DinG [Vibrio splendidus]
MPSDNIVKAIRDSYAALKTSLPSFEPRSHQNYMVAEITKALSGDLSNNIVVVEAGTGTGKSLGYLMSAIPVAREQGLKVVVSTATVALQEQLVDKDLPFYNEHIAPVNYVLAKGKGRYCCVTTLQKMVSSIDGIVDDQIQLDFKMEDADRDLLKTMLSSFKDGSWNGERDSLKETVSDKLWSAISSHGSACKKSPEHMACPFHSARAAMMKADVIIANHSLVSSDLSLGGGVVLPAQDETIYVFDEAHHLPTIVRDADKNHFSLNGSAVWLDNFFQAMQKNQKEILFSDSDLEKLHADKDGMILVLDQAQIALKELPYKDGVLRFRNGVIQDNIASLFNNLLSYSKSINTSLKKARENLKDNEELDDEPRGKVSTDLDFHSSRSRNVSDTLYMLLSQDEKRTYAKWLEIDADMKVSVHANTLDVSDHLKASLFDLAAGVVLTSATISTMNNFEYFKLVSGVPAESLFVRLSSPFDYPNNAELYLPKVKIDPSSPRFTGELIDQVRAAIFNAEYKSSLILFTSYVQMKEVAKALEAEVNAVGGLLGVQGQGSRTVILSEHRTAVDKGRLSVLFGTQGFSEGLDLQGNYLKQVVITKIPFAVPNEPVGEAYAELIESRGGNSFMDISLPEASRKLIQSAGRLIRTKTDTGRVIILDNRLLTKRYGTELIKALPPFKVNVAA